jgi:hypothetical protein
MSAIPASGAASSLSNPRKRAGASAIAADPYVSERPF